MCVLKNHVFGPITSTTCVCVCNSGVGVGVDDRVLVGVSSLVSITVGLSSATVSLIT